MSDNQDLPTLPDSPLLQMQMAQVAAEHADGMMRRAVLDDSRDGWARWASARAASFWIQRNSAEDALFHATRIECWDRSGQALGLKCFDIAVWVAVSAVRPQLLGRCADRAEAVLYADDRGDQTGKEVIRMAVSEEIAALAEKTHDRA